MAWVSSGGLRVWFWASYGFLFSCRTVGQASDSVAALTWGFGLWVGA